MSSLIMMVSPTPARRDHHAGAHNVATLVPRHWEHLNGQLSAQLSVGDLGYEIPWVCTIHTHP